MFLTVNGNSFYKIHIQCVYFYVYVCIGVYTCVFYWWFYSKCLSTTIYVGQCKCVCLCVCVCVSVHSSSVYLEVNLYAVLTVVYHMKYGRCCSRCCCNCCCRKYLTNCCCSNCGCFACDSDLLTKCFFLFFFYTFHVFFKEFSYKVFLFVFNFFF